MLYEVHAVSVGESVAQLIVEGELVENDDGEESVVGRFEEFDDFGDVAAILNLLADLFVEGEILDEPEGELEEDVVVAAEEATEFLHQLLLAHLGLILAHDRHLLEEEQRDNEEVEVVALQHADEVGDDLALLHLLLDRRVLRHVQQQREADVEQLVLLGDHQVQLPQLLRVLRGLRLIQLHELAIADIESLDLVLDDLHRRIAQLVLLQQTVELRVVRQDVEATQQERAQLRRLLVLITQVPRYCRHELVFNIITTPHHRTYRDSKETPSS
jgi:hypothetical protein